MRACELVPQCRRDMLPRGDCCVSMRRVCVQVCHLHKIGFLGLSLVGVFKYSLNLQGACRTTKVCRDVVKPSHLAHQGPDEESMPLIGINCCEIVIPLAIVLYPLHRKLPCGCTRFPTSSGGAGFVDGYGERPYVEGCLKLHELSVDFKSLTSWNVKSLERTSAVTKIKGLDFVLHGYPVLRSQVPPECPERIKGFQPRLLMHKNRVEYKPRCW